MPLSQSGSTLSGKAALTGAGRAAMLEQTERVLQSPLFAHSKRYPAVLRYLVDRALSGATDLKERTIGIDVFGRAPSYDTNSEPTVRVVAGEIRRRLTLYYLQPGRESEIRIDLPPGSYVPDFSFPAGGAAQAMARPRRTGRLYVAAGVLIAAILVAAAWRQSHPPMTAVERFWEPVLKGSKSVLLCVSSRKGPSSSSAGAPEATQTFQTTMVGQEEIGLMNAVATSGIAAFLQSKGVTHRIRTADSTSLTDLRDGPAVLIGAFGNQWTMRVTDAMRYRLKTATDLNWIEDRENPSRQQWSVRFSLPYAEVTADYGLIARTLDASTGRMVVTVGGLSPLGTEAAAEFLANPAYMETVASKVPQGWENKNIEIVIETKLVNGNSGPPSAVATHFW